MQVWEERVGRVLHRTARTWLRLVSLDVQPLPISILRELRGNWEESTTRELEDAEEEEDKRTVRTCLL